MTKPRIRYRKYTTKDRPPERDPIVANPIKLNKYRATCRRRAGSPGRLVVDAEAETPEELHQKILDGSLQGIGLGWRPIKIELLSEVTED